jgi:hypothetical protein
MENKLKAQKIEATSLVDLIIYMPDPATDLPPRNAISALQ